MVGKSDKSTLPIYQKEYGAGYGPDYGAGEGKFKGYFEEFIDKDGNKYLTVPFGEDASFGAPFDPNMLVYHWEAAFADKLSADGKPHARSWVAPNSVATDFLKTSVNSTQSIAIDGLTDKGAFRLSYTNNIQKGILPNSKIEKNTVALNASHRYFNKLKASAGIAYTNTDAIGRYGTGYAGINPFQSFRQWWQVNVDILEQKREFEQTGENISWNIRAFDNTERPKYMDNPYWARYNKYSTDERNRYIGNVSLNYEIDDAFSVLGRVALDTYDEIREERINIGSNDVSEYAMFKQNVSEINYDLILSFNKDIAVDLNLEGLLGLNLRVNKRNFFKGSTNGGLLYKDLFSLKNSVSPLTPNDVENYDAISKVDGRFGRVSLGYKDTYFVEATLRHDRSSTLPVENNNYFYPSVSGAFIFSNLIDVSWLKFGKLRANYAKVGNDSTPYRVFNTYTIVSPFQGEASLTAHHTFYDRDLREERTIDKEIGIELRLLKGLTIDLSLYNRLTKDLITPIKVSGSTGVERIHTNGGSVSNKGIEIFLSANIVDTSDFKWRIAANYSKNTSKVESLKDDIDYLELTSPQGGISIGAKVGEPYGVIRGTDFLYHANGKKIINSEGFYEKSKGDDGKTVLSNKVIGDFNPDYTAGVKNTFSYKGISLSFLIDIQKGGDFFGLDTWYGFETGLYDISAGNNQKGNPLRDRVEDGGGRLLEGVNEDGTPNETYGEAYKFGSNALGYKKAPHALHVYDASFVKLREISLGYNIPQSILKRTPFANANFSIVGRNLWIIHKNAPYTDPEAGLSAGNIQGYQSGAYPSVKEIGASLKINF